jgi:hypothetical protein
VPVPFFVGAAARRILALRAGLAFLSGVLKELVGFRFRVGELLRQVALQCRRLQAVTPLQLGTRVVQIEFVGQVLCRYALREAAKDHHDDAGPVADAREHRAGERVENGSALAAAVAYYRSALATGVRSLTRR